MTRRNKFLVLLVGLIVLLLVVIAGLKLRTRVVLGDMREVLQEISHEAGLENADSIEVFGTPSCTDQCLLVFEQYETDMRAENIKSNLVSAGREFEESTNSNGDLLFNITNKNNEVTVTITHNLDRTQVSVGRERFIGF